MRSTLRILADTRDKTVVSGKVAAWTVLLSPDSNPCLFTAETSWAYVVAVSRSVLKYDVETDVPIRAPSSIYPIGAHPAFRIAGCAPG